MRARNVLVVGCGIAGLTAARALVRDGHRVRLVERARAFETVGAGIVLQGNALAALDAIGLGERVRAVGHRPTNGGIFTAAGAPLLPVDPRVLEERPLIGDTVALYRPELHAVLAEAVDEVPTHLGARPTCVEDHGDRVFVALDDGWSGEVDLVVGADGIHSQVRALVLGEQAPEVVYAGYTCWRAIAANRAGITRVTETWGRGKRVGLVPLAGDRIYAFLVANAPRGGREEVDLREHFSAFDGEPAAFLASLASEDTVMRHDIDELADVVWGRGRGILIGDAAHAMTPNMGQGAAQGIEDAVALAAVLREHDDDGPVLDALVGLRDARVRMVKGRSRTIGAVGQWEGWLACWLRDTLGPWVPARASASSLEGTLRPGVALAARVAAPWA